MRIDFVAAFGTSANSRKENPAQTYGPAPGLSKVAKAYIARTWADGAFNPLEEAEALAQERCELGSLPFLIYLAKPSCSRCLN